MVGLAPRMRGTSSGEVQALTSPQEQMIERIICNKRTEQLKMDLALGTEQRGTAHRARMRRCAACEFGRKILGALGVRAAKADQESLRETP